MKPKQISYAEVAGIYWNAAPFADGYKSEYTSLFFAVLDSVSYSNWSDCEIEYDRITHKSGLGKRMYLEARKWLRDNGFITLIEGKGDYQKAKFGVLNAVHFCTTRSTTYNTTLITASSTADVLTPAPHQAPNNVYTNFSSYNTELDSSLSNSKNKEVDNTTTSQNSENPQSQNASQLSLQEPSNSSDIKMLDYLGVIDELMHNDKALMYLSRAHNIKTDIDRKRIIEAFAMHLELDNKLPAKASGVCQHFCFWCPKRKYADATLFEPTIQSIVAQEKPSKPYLGPTNFFREQDYLNYNNAAGWSGLQIPAYRGQYNQAKEFAATMNPQYGFTNLH